MGIRLKLLSFWTPNCLLGQMLDKVSSVTVNALKEVLQVYAPNAQLKTAHGKLSSRNINEKRVVMAKTQTFLINALAEALGQETAVKLGREALFKVGEQLGSQTRESLGVSESQDDLVKAARIMYRVLGISFSIQWQEPTQATLTVDHCALAENYSELTCRVLSAVDEGVVRGLNPNMSMNFENRITSGCNTCIARIQETRSEKP